MRIKYLPARELIPEDVIVHKGRKLVIKSVGKLFAFVQIKAVRRVDSAEVELVLHGRLNKFVLREDTHGPTPEPVSGLRDRTVFLRTYPRVRLVPGNGSVRDLPWFDTSGPAAAGAVRLGFGDPGAVASATDIPVWSGRSGVGWRGTVPFVPEGWAGGQRQAPLVARDGSWARAAEGPMGEGGVVSDMQATIPAQGGPPVGHDRPAERSGYLRVDDLLKSLHALSV